MVIVIQILSFNMENGRWSILMFCIYWNEYNVFKEWVSTVVSFRISFLFISESYSSTIWIMKRTISSISFISSHNVSYTSEVWTTHHWVSSFTSNWSINYGHIIHSLHKSLLFAFITISSVRESASSWVCWVNRRCW